MLPQCLPLSFSSIQLMILEEMSKMWKANNERTTTDNRPRHKLTCSKAPGELITSNLSAAVVIGILRAKQCCSWQYRHTRLNCLVGNGNILCVCGLWQITAFLLILSTVKEQLVLESLWYDNQFNIKFAWAVNNKKYACDKFCCFFYFCCFFFFFL